MSSITENNLTKQMLFNDLETNETVYATQDVIDKAKSGSGEALHHIGNIYCINKKEFTKAIEWYRLSEGIDNNNRSQYMIAWLYEKGLGIPRDYHIAMDWYLKSARQKNEFAYKAIGELFLNGKGVPRDEYKALEWFRKHDKNSSDVNYLKKKGSHIAKHEKKKLLEQLIEETEDILKTQKYNIGANILEGIPPKSANSSEYNISIRTDTTDSLESPTQVSSPNKSNISLEEQLKLKDDKISLLENEIQLLRMEIEQQTLSAKRIGELERSNKNLEKLLEQERRLKDNEMQLMKQDFHILLKKKKMSKERKGDELKKQNKVVVKKELRAKKSKQQINSTINYYYSSTSSNSTYETEYDSAESE